MSNQQTNKKIISFTLIMVLFSVINICKGQTEIKIPEESLPAAVHDDLHKKYSDYHVNSITKNTSVQPAVYTLEIQKKNRLIRLIYDADGKLIEKEKSKIYSFDGSEPVKSRPVPSNDGHNHQH